MDEGSHIIAYNTVEVSIDKVRVVAAWGKEGSREYCVWEGCEDRFAK